MIKWDQTRSCAGEQVQPDQVVQASGMWSISIPLTINCQCAHDALELRAGETQKRGKKKQLLFHTDQPRFQPTQAGSERPKSVKEGAKLPLQRSDHREDPSADGMSDSAETGDRKRSHGTCFWFCFDLQLTPAGPEAERY